MADAIVNIALNIKTSADKKPVEDAKNAIERLADGFKNAKKPIEQLRVAMGAMQGVFSTVSAAFDKFADITHRWSEESALGSRALGQLRQASEGTLSTTELLAAAHRKFGDDLSHVTEYQLKDFTKELRASTEAMSDAEKHARQTRTGWHDLVDAIEDGAGATADFAVALAGSGPQSMKEGLKQFTFELVPAIQLQKEWAHRIREGLSDFFALRDTILDIKNAVSLLNIEMVATFKSDTVGRVKDAVRVTEDYNRLVMENFTALGGAQHNRGARTLESRALGALSGLAGAATGAVSSGPEYDPFSSVGAGGGGAASGPSFSLDRALGRYHNAGRIVGGVLSGLSNRASASDAGGALGSLGDFAGGLIGFGDKIFERGQRKFGNFTSTSYEEGARNDLLGGLGERDVGQSLEQLQKMSEAVKGLTDITKPAGAAFGALTAGFAAAVDAAISGGDGIAKAFAKAASAALKTTAIQASVNALFETAKGFAALALGSPSAAVHFKAAGVFAATAAAAGVGAAGLGALAGGGGNSAARGAASAPGGGFVGGRSGGGEGTTVIVQIGAGFGGTAGDAQKLGEVVNKAVRDAGRAGRGGRSVVSFS